MPIVLLLLTYGGSTFMKQGKKENQMNKKYIEIIFV